VASETFVLGTLAPYLIAGAIVYLFVTKIAKADEPPTPTPTPTPVSTPTPVPTPTPTPGTYDGTYAGTSFSYGGCLQTSNITITNGNLTGTASLCPSQSGLYGSGVTLIGVVDHSSGKITGRATVGSNTAPLIASGLVSDGTNNYEVLWNADFFGGYISIGGTATKSQ
jgi:hypothetical protein